MRFHFSIRTNYIRYGTISEIPVVDQKFRISYILLLNSITVKNMKFKVHFHEGLHASTNLASSSVSDTASRISNIQKSVYYLKANRELYISYLSNYVHFLSQLEVITI